MHEVQLRGDIPHTVHRPTSIDEALRLRAELGPSAKLVAGATDLLLEFTRGQHGDVTALIDLSAMAEANSIVVGDDRVSIGPLVTHNQIVANETLWADARPLAEACWEIGSPQLRNRATVVGNVATASPANDTISALRVLDAELTLQSIEGSRVVPIADFHTGVRRTVLADDELITSISFRRLASHERGVFVKAGLRAAQAISVVHVAVVVGVKDGIVSSAKIALGSVAPTIVEAVVDVIVGRPLSEDSIRTVAHTAAASVRPIDDVRATAEYRSDAVRVVLQRGLTSLMNDPAPARVPVLLSPSGTAHQPALADTTVNGRSVEPSGVDGLTLLDWLRDVAGPAAATSLTGTKEGCAEGECGACTVQLNGAAVMSCLVPAAAVAGSQVVTVEGIGGDDLHPVQQAFIDQFAVQCGYCIPGFIVAGASLLDEVDDVTREQVVDGLAGNLCRCTGYYKIIDAMLEAGA